MLVAFVAISTAAFAQGRRGLFINEVMVQNDSSVVDDYGLRHGWIELFNSTFAPMEISSVYLTNDKSKPTLYPVPLGDVNTEVPARQHVLFWADAEPDKGIFHISFKIKPGETLYIFDANKKTILDSVTIPTDLQPNMTYARVEDGNVEKGWEVRDGSAEKYITPSSNNVIQDTNSKVEMFAEKDGAGIILTIMAMAIVFSALLVLCLCFYGISKIGEKTSSDNKMRSHGVEPKAVAKTDAPAQDSGEEIAAIVMALHEHLNAHDQENTILTINKVKKAYSPWSSKIYGLRELPRR